MIPKTINSIRAFISPNLLYSSHFGGRVPFRAFLDCAYYGNYANKDGAVRHLGDDEFGMGDKDGVDESVNIYPGKLDPNAAAIVVVITPAKYKKGRGTDVPEDMFVTVSVQQQGDATAKEVTRTDIPKKARVEGGSGAIIATVFYREGGKFHVRHSYTVTGRNTWGGCIPVMKQELKSFLLPDIVVDPTEALATLRKASSYPIDELRATVDKTYRTAALNKVETEGGAGMPASGAAMMPPPGGALPTPAGETPEMVVKQIRFDLGWAVKEDATEKVDLDINIIAFDGEGEVLTKINYASREAPGLQLGKDQFRIDAAALKAKPLAFEVFEQAHVSLPDLPEGANSLVFACTNFTDTGFDVMEKVRCRIVDVTVGAVERDLAVFVVDTSRAEALSKELGVQKTGVIVAKLSLDVPGGIPLVEEAKDEYKAWAKQVHAAEKALQSLKLAAADPERAAEKAAAAAAAAGDVPTYMHGAKVVKTVEVGEYPKGLDAIVTAPSAVPPPPSLERAMAAVDAKWGTAGYATHAKQRVWALRAVGLFCEGRKLEDALIYLNAVCVFDGKRDHRGFRHDADAIIKYPNGDRYFGPYDHGKRKGLGVYIFEEGGIFVGNYEKGKRKGLGIHVTKSGSVYTGEHARDLASGVGRLRQPSASAKEAHATGGEWVGVFDKVG